MRRTELSLIQRAAEVVKQGGIIAYPTESCFGFGCAPDNISSIKRIRRLKQRTPEQGFVVVADKIERLQKYLRFDELDESSIATVRKSWPGAFNWLIPISEGCPRELTGEYNTLAVRISAFETLRLLCQYVQGGLVSTSANLRGSPPLKTGKEVYHTFKNDLDFVLDLPVEGQEKPCQIIDARTQNIIRFA